jgi:hypothetical protein
MCRATPKFAVPILAVMFLVVGLTELRSQTIDWSSPAARQEMQGFQQFLTNILGLPTNCGRIHRSPITRASCATVLNSHNS